MTSSGAPRAGSTVFEVAAGWAAAPIRALRGFARHARPGHLPGTTFHAKVLRHPRASAELATLADRLAGRALVRFSGALWQRRETAPDVLVCALRLRRDDGDSPEPKATDQDLLFATVQRPWAAPLSPFLTDVSDYLANDYYALSPFDAGLAERVYLRLRPECAGPWGGDLDEVEEGDADDEERSRGERLAAEVERGRATLKLELGRGPYGPWTPIAAVSLERRAHVDDEALRFRPSRDGRGLRPSGFVRALLPARFMP
ncbi:MAG: hypothetical protein FWD17_19855 [Polyangiaceae bacterium]|nr:hypothetical protein [Polyangiaceae bacterium]